MSTTKKIEEERIKFLNEEEIREDGRYVLYWMEKSQRAEQNHALEYAIQQTNDLDLPLLAVFALTDEYPDINARHYTFLLEGLQETEKDLKDRDIKLICRFGNPPAVVSKLTDKAALIVTDMGYLREQREWRKKVANQADCKVVQVESDIAIPVEVVSDKEEYAARTIRPKIHDHLNNYLVKLTQTSPKNSSINLNETGEDLSKIDKIIDKLQLERITPVSEHFKGGTSEGKKHFRKFLKKHLDSYDDNRSHPETDDVSHTSKYIHFGQISIVWLALEAKDKGKGKNLDSFIEELIVRRELAINYVYYNDKYDSFKGLPDWAHETLEKHKDDDREHTYTRSELENAETHDEYWNASMREMKHTGYMHNYMRMYWGKKILEWSNTPQYAFKTAITLNNKYFVDGRDPNSYTNVSWLFGQHDRGWQERPVYGKVRSMMASGLERKFDPQEYVEKVNELVEESEK